VAIYAVEIHGAPQDGSEAYEKNIKQLRFNMFLQLQSPENIVQIAKNEIERRGCLPASSPHKCLYYLVEERHLEKYDNLYSTLYSEALENGSAVIALDDTEHFDESGKPQVIYGGSLEPIDH